MPSPLQRLFLTLLAFVATALPPFASAEPGLSVPTGFTVEIATTPGLVGFPMMGCFDERGRLFLAESAGHNMDDKQLDTARPNFIRMIEDTDGDGVFDKSTVFADKLAIPNGALWLDGALYVAEPPGIWRFTDTDDDGVADKREHLAGNVRSNGMSSTLHGPVLHPSGWLFWCGGQQGYHLDKNQDPPEGRIAPGVFCLKPDGSEHQIFAVGGMANPVEVTFSENGDVFGTLAILDRPDGVRHDGLLHWVYGGRFRPREDSPVPLKRTGPPLPPLSHVGQVAPAGLTRYRGAAFGDAFRDDIFWSQFNTHTVMRTKIEPAGATYTSTDETFLTSTSVDFHPTDVIEDADGSLLVVDTGGWFRHGCPTSHIAKREALGGVYRIRRNGAPAVKDPRGREIGWDELKAEEIAALLDDPRPAVEDRAIATLAKRDGDDTIDALADALNSSESLQTRRNAIWTLSRIGTPTALDFATEALEDKDPSVRKSASFALGMMRHRHAGDTLERILERDEDPGVRREAATALGRIGDETSISHLLGAMAGPGDPFLQHSLIYALIEINHPRDVVAQLPPDAHPRTRRGALLALSQMEDFTIGSELITSVLRAKDPELQRAAFEVALHDAKLQSEAIKTLRGIFSPTAAEPDDARLAVCREAFLSLAAGADGQALVADLLSQPMTAEPVRLLLLDVMRNAPLKTLPDAWIAALVHALEADSPGTKMAIAALARDRSLKQLDPDMIRMAGEPHSSAALRMACLNAAAPRLKTVAETHFAFVREQLASAESSSGRLEAARTLAALPLSANQLIALATTLPQADALVLPTLTRAFSRSKADAVGMALIAALEAAPAVSSVPADELARLFKAYPEKTQSAARPLLQRLGTDLAQQEARLDEMSVLLADGDFSRGKQLFFGKAICATCHRVSGQGGLYGPNLSTIAEIRGGRDLLESLLYPSASIVQGYHAMILETGTGEMLTGLITRESAEAVWLQGIDLSERRLESGSIRSLRESPVSLMPQGLDQTLAKDELRDLLAFLQGLKRSSASAPER